MKHKVEIYTNGSWVTEKVATEKVENEVKKEKHISKVEVKYADKIVSISEKYAEILNQDSKVNGKRYVKLATAKKPKATKK
jgi:hypothetical protein